jgi:hypothetical protein
MNKFILYGLLFFLISCKKNNQQVAASNPVPLVPINYVLYPDDPINFNIQYVGGWIYIDNVGVSGIIVYRKSLEEFFVMDRASSYSPDNFSSRVKVMSDNFLLKDTISNSQWRIIDAQVVNGPAVWPLRTYGTTYINGALRITN